MATYDDFRRVVFGWAKLTVDDLKDCIHEASKLVNDLEDRYKPQANKMLQSMQHSLAYRIKNSQLNEGKMITDKEIDLTIGTYDNTRELIDLIRKLQEERKWKPIETAPVSLNSRDQILCRFWYNGVDPHWVYMICLPNGANTQANGYAKPEEWLPLSLTKD